MTTSCICNLVVGSVTVRESGSPNIGALTREAYAWKTLFKHLTGTRNIGKSSELLSVLWVSPKRCILISTLGASSRKGKYAYFIWAEKVSDDTYLSFAQLAVREKLETKYFTMLHWLFPSEGRVTNILCHGKTLVSWKHNILPMKENTK